MQSQVSRALQGVHDKLKDIRHHHAGMMPVRHFISPRNAHLPLAMVPSGTHKSVSLDTEIDSGITYPSNIIVSDLGPCGSVFIFTRFRTTSALFIEFKITLIHEGKAVVLTHNDGGFGEEFNLFPKMSFCTGDFKKTSRRGIWTLTAEQVSTSTPGELPFWQGWELHIVP